MNRRTFLSLSASAAAALPFASQPDERAQPRGGQPPTTVLFQGDSITDGGRARNDREPNRPLALGAGYPFLVATELLRREPGTWRFFNRGVSGDRVPDLAARWDDDTIAIAPQILTILIGVNDYWHARAGRYGASAEDYENGYLALLERTRRALPDTRIYVLEPFVLPVGFVDRTWLEPFRERRAIARRVAERTNSTFIPLQDAFDEAAGRSSPEDVAYDGIHPAPAGHGLIADAVLRTLRNATNSR
jgi:lysophospholipase L1-like esterase